MAILASIRHLGVFIVAALIWTGLIFGTSPVNAGESEAGTYGAPFLRIPVGARQTASPDIVAGMRPDASFVFSNPAFTSGLSYTEIFFSTSNWLDDMRFSAAGAVFPMPGQKLTLSVGTSLLYSGGLKGYDEGLNVVSEENYYDLSLRTSVSRRFDSIGLSLGVGGAYIRQHMYPQDGDGFSFTAGASYRLGRNTFHVVAQDLGGKVSFPGAEYAVDTQTKIGAGRTFELRYGHINAGTQVVFSQSTNNRIQLGVDYVLNRFFSLHTALPDALNETGEAFPFSAGFGVRYGQIAVDYAYTPRDYFSNTHTVSIIFSMGNLGPVLLADERGAVLSEPPASVDRSPDPGPDPKHSKPKAPPKASKNGVKTAAATYSLIAGVHGWIESASSEVHALKLQGVKSTIESKNSKFRVVVGHYTDREKAAEALKDFRKKGHRFFLVED